MRRPSSLVPTSGIAVLLALGLLGCGGAAPEDDGGAGARGTSITQLCGALTDFRADLASADSTDTTTYVAQLKAASTRLDDVGLPDAMPAEARAGFEQQVALIAALPDAATASDLDAVGKAATDPALQAYLATACPDL